MNQEQSAITLSYDIIVVGAGGSGLAAAASAAELGAEVLVLEKQAEPGGSTKLAVGSFTASQTPIQKAAGITDGIADHLEDVGKFAPPELESRNNDELRTLLVREAPATLEWLMRLGLTFHGPTPEPPNRAPRMHNVIPGARAYVLTLQRHLIKHGGRILFSTPVTKLIQEEGRVVGVGSNGKTFRARHGVVLAAGDYASAPDLLAKYKGEEYANVEGVCKSSHGDGHRLSESVGAKLINMDVTYGPELRFLPPERLSLLRRLPAEGPLRRVMSLAMPLTPKVVMDAIIKRELVTWQHPENALFDDGAILVNREGERFCDERESLAREIAVSNQPGKTAYILLDARLCIGYSAWPHYVSTAPEIAYAYVADYLRLRPDIAVRGDTLREVAEARGIPATTLEKTVSEFNEEADEPLEEPWVLLGPAKAYFTITEGSPAVNRNLQVLDDVGHPIPGLYAVGQNGIGGQILWGHGLHIAWAMTSGRLVGTALARSRYV
jgi:fumarate reductase flavoprotein subunit